MALPCAEVAHRWSRLLEPIMTRSLALVRTAPDDAPESIAQRVQRLNAEAHQLARQHIQLLVSRMDEVASVAEEIAVGGDAYPPGVRDLSRRAAEDLRTRALTIAALTR